MSGKGMILGLAGLGAVGLILRAASKTTSAPAEVQKTYVEKALDTAKAKTTSATSSKVTTAKTYAQKGTAEVRAAVNAIDQLLK